MVGQAISSVLSLLILIAIGFYMAGLSWFKDHGPDTFSKYCVKIAIPCYMAYNVIETCGTREELLRIATYLPIPFFALFVNLAMGFLLVKIFKINPPRRGVFLNVVTLSNIVIIGFPVITSLFGESAAPHGMVYYMANTILFWTVGVYLLRLDSGAKQKLFSLANLKQILSPPIVGFFAGVVIVLLGIELPGFIFSPLQMIKNSVSPIALMFIGSILRQTNFKEMRLTKDVIVVLISRFVFSPLLIWVLCSFLPVENGLKQVLFILSTMPAMTQLGIM
ncbi:MAG: AEC family transporter, partial [Oscillospiraceae bacterium]|nr:AEC family transporter [Oscillospiraceae bacterium]